MKTLRFLLDKEFRQIFRNRTILAMIIVMPVMQLIILPLAADYEIKNINLAIVDHDHSPLSARLIQKVSATGYFKAVGYGSSYARSLKLLEADKADLILEIPFGFETNLVREDRNKLLLAANAINGMKANLGAAYLVQIIRDYNTDLLLTEAPGPRFSPAPRIEPVPSYWYNPLLNYRIFMVPGILAILVTMIGGFLSALNIVKEKEVGTIEQINVTPIKKHHFILGKLIPFWVLGNIVFTMGLIVARIFYGIIPVGNLALLYGFVAVFLLAILGFGLLISTYCESQQQAMFIMFFFMMIFILMGGLFTSIDGMPEWAKWIARLNPVTYFIETMRMIILKGSGWKDISAMTGIIACFAIVLNGWAIINYRKTT